MTFLRLLSQHGYQNFTYTCINSAAWYNTKTENHNLAIKILGENEQEFSHRSGVKPTIVSDGCKVSANLGLPFGLFGYSHFPRTDMKLEAKLKNFNPSN